MATGFGRDTWCRDTMRPGHLVTGKDLLAQALYRRLITPRGTLATDPNYGLDVASYLGAMGDVALAALPSLIEAELRKDDRVQTVVVTPSITRASDATERMILDISVRSIDPGVSFSLTIAVDDVSVEWLEAN